MTSASWTSSRSRITTDADQRQRAREERHEPSVTSWSSAWMSFVSREIRTPVLCRLKKPIDWCWRWAKIRSRRSCRRAGRPSRRGRSGGRWRPSRRAPRRRTRPRSRSSAARSPGVMPSSIASLRQVGRREAGRRREDQRDEHHRTDAGTGRSSRAASAAPPAMALAADSRPSERDERRGSSELLGSSALSFAFGPPPRFRSSSPAPRGRRGPLQDDRAARPFSTISA